jgi:hypothetical protein
MTLEATRELDRVRAVEGLLERVEALPEPARGTAVALVGGLLALYGEALARITDAAGRTGAEALRTELAADELVSHLLLLHGLHPQGAPERVTGALHRLAPRLGRARAELVSVDGEVARLRVQGAGGCGASALEELLEEAVRAAAPEVARVEVVHAAAPPTVIPLDGLRQRIDGPRPSTRTGHDPA